VFRASKCAFVSRPTVSRGRAGSETGAGIALPLDGKVVAVLNETTRKVVVL
jgi:hypothetical protein